MTTRFALIGCLLAALVLGLAACGDDDKENEATGGGSTTAETATTPEQTATDEAAPPGTCEKVEAPKPRAAKEYKKPTLELDRSKRYVARVLTNCGEFEITLDAKRAPRTGGSFVYLAREGFFDGLTFHRIVPGFVIQGGDPGGDGTGGPGYSVVEAPPADLAYTRGVVAMAKTGTEKEGTSGSQFFVVTGEDAGLPPEYALLGKVTKGQDVVDAIGTAPTDQQTERPVDPIVMRQVTISER